MKNFPMKLMWPTKPANVDQAVASRLTELNLITTFKILKETTLPNGRFRVEVELGALSRS